MRKQQQQKASVKGVRCGGGGGAAALLLSQGVGGWRGSSAALSRGGGGCRGARHQHMHELARHRRSQRGGHCVAHHSVSGGNVALQHHAVRQSLRPCTLAMCQGAVVGIVEKAGCAGVDGSGVAVDRRKVRAGQHAPKPVCAVSTTWAAGHHSINRFNSSPHRPGAWSGMCRLPRSSAVSSSSGRSRQLPARAGSCPLTGTPQ